MQDPTILAASLASSDQSHQAGLGEAAPVVFLLGAGRGGGERLLSGRRSHHTG